MTREEQIICLREHFRSIQRKAEAILRNDHANATEALANDRNYARAIMFAADDAFQTCVALLGFPEMERKDPNSHIGANRE